jgi:hypothetical protein
MPFNFEKLLIDMNALRVFGRYFAQPDFARREKSGSPLVETEPGHVGRLYLSIEHRSQPVLNGLEERKKAVPLLRL